MNTFRDQIRHLIEKDTTFPYLSLYLPVNGDIQPETLLNSLISEYKELDQPAVKETLENMKSHVKSWSKFSGGRTLVAFGPAGQIETQFMLEAKYEPFLAVGPAPHVAPLKSYLNKNNSYLVILLERERAVMYSYQFDQLKLVEQLEGVVPQKVRRGSGNRMGFRSDPNEHRIDRHTQWHLREFFKHVGNYAFNMFNRGMALHGYDHVILGTHTQLATAAKESFPSFVSERVVAEFNVDIDEPLEAIRAKISIARDSYEKRAERELLQKIDDNKNTDGIAAVGLDEVKNNLDLGTVSELVVNKDYSDVKPFEFSDMFKRALRQDADIRVIKHNQELLPQGIGAILRFRP